MGSSEISISHAVLVMVAVAVVGVASFAEAQVADCAQKLTVCSPYLKSGNPPASCCGPIKEVVATQHECLCNLYTSPGFLQSIGVNVTDALRLTKACGVPDDVAECKTSAPAPQRGPPPAVPGNGADRLALTGFTSILMFWAGLILH